MAIKDILPQLRRDRGLTQEELAARLYVTRQAVSRWENGETTPNIDMTKLLATVLAVPVACLLEMPERFCQSCGMPLASDDMFAKEKALLQATIACTATQTAHSPTKPTSIP